MSTQITVDLSDETLKRAEWLATETGRPIGELLAETIELSLKPLTGSGNGSSITNWSDDDVLAAADGQMSEADDRSLGELLDRQQAGLLNAPEQAELAALLECYQRGLLRKALALREAVRRGLREPLEP